LWLLPQHQSQMELWLILEIQGSHFGRQCPSFLPFRLPPEQQPDCPDFAIQLEPAFHFQTIPSVSKSLWHPLLPQQGPVRWRVVMHRIEMVPKMPRHERLLRPLPAHRKQELISAPPWIDQALSDSIHTYPMPGWSYCHFSKYS